MATKNQIKAGNKGRQEGFDYENYIIKEANLLGYEASPVDQKIGKKTAKGDLELNGEKCSVKNTKAFNTSTQIQIITQSSFSELHDVEPEVEEYIRLFCGHEDILSTSSEMGIQLDSEESRRKRMNCSTIPPELSVKFLEFLRDNKKRILRGVFSEGTLPDNPETHASKIIWCDPTRYGKGNTEDIFVADIEKVVDYIVENFDWKIRKSDTVLELGPVTLQMKGSGKKGSSSYHSLQFNASLKDLSTLCPNLFVKNSLSGHLESGML